MAEPSSPSKIPVFRRHGVATTPTKKVIGKECLLCSQPPSVYSRHYLKLFSKSKAGEAKSKLFIDGLSKLLKCELTEENCPSHTVCMKCKTKVEQALKSEEDTENMRRVVGRKIIEYPRTKRSLPTDVQRSPAARKAISFARAEPQKMQPRSLLPKPVVPADSISFPEKTEPSTGKVEVTLETSRKKLTIVVEDSFKRNVVKQTVLGTKKQVADALWNDADMQTTLSKKVIDKVEKEVVDLCATSKPSILRTTDPLALVSVTPSAVCKELQERAPTFYTMLETITGSQKSKTSKDNLLTITSGAAVILKGRNMHMSAWAAKNSLTLEHGGCSTMAMKRLAKQNVTVDPNTTRARKKVLAKDHDKVILEQKETLEKDIVKEMVVNELLTVDGLTMEHLQSSRQGTVTETEGSVEQTTHVPLQIQSRGLDTDFLPSLAWSFYVPENEDKDQDEDTRIFERLKDFEKDYAGHFGLVVDEVISHSQTLECDTLLRLKKAMRDSKSAGYQVIGDNVDLLIKARHMSSERQNKDIHWFFMYAAIDEVSGSHLDNFRMPKVSDVPLTKCLPNSFDVKKLKYHCMVLWSRVVVHWIPALQCLSKAVVRHIPHHYENTMKAKTTTVPLGLLCKNENLPEDMLFILKHVQDRYVPQRVNKDKENEILEQIFFGGDNLTVERAVNAQRASLDGDSPWERLQGIVAKNEDWHADRNKFQRVVNKLNKPESAGDPGTMFSNATVTNNANAKLDPLENYTKVKEPFNLYLDVYIVAATMAYLRLESIEENVEIVPDKIKSASLDDQREWLHALIQPMIEQFVLPSLSTESLQTLSRSAEEPKTYECPLCKKSYKYQGALQNHMSKQHQETAESNPAETEATVEQEDHIFNYGCVFITLGLMLRNSDDAVKEGDGERIISMWKFFLPIWKNEGSTKYALSALELFLTLYGRLTEQAAHRLIWNRTINKKGGKGKRISRDFYIENLNLVLKDSFKHLGVNINEKTAVLESQALYGIDIILNSQNQDLGLKKPSGYHKKVRSELDFKIVLNEVVRKCDMFNVVVGREFHSFPGFNRSILHGLDHTGFIKWMKAHKRKLEIEDEVRSYV